MLSRITNYLWGHLSRDELVKFGGLAIAYFLLIGAQWPLKSAKDILLVDEMGYLSQPGIKILATAVCFLLAILYSALISFFHRERMVYLVSSVYAILCVGIASVLSFGFVDLKTQSRAFSIFFYLFAESFSAISIAPFWSIVNDITKPNEAKKGYPIIVFMGQVGGLVFMVLAKMFASHIRSVSKDFAYIAVVPMLTLGISVTLVLFIFSVFMTMRSISSKLQEGFVAKKIESKKVDPKAEAKKGPIIKNFLNGLSLIICNPYVAGIFLLTAFQEVAATLMHFYVMKFSDVSFIDKAAKSAFMENYNVAIQVVAVLFAAFGTSWFERKIGVRGCLLGYPMFVMILMISLLIVPQVAFIDVAYKGMVIILIVALGKGLNYALNKPTREILYIPTSKDVKYRSKAWIEVFGSRFAKMTGAGANWMSGVMVALIPGISVVLPVIWIGVSKAVGDKYHKSVRDKESIG